MCLHLSGEHLVAPVVVEDRGQARRLSVERDRRQRTPLRQEPADQLGGEVLRLGCAAAVAGREHPSAIRERPGELFAPRLDERPRALASTRPSLSSRS